MAIVLEPSIVMAPLASISKVEVSISNAVSAAVPKFIPPAPSIVNAPAEVVKLEAAPASIETPPEESIVVVALSMSTFPFMSNDVPTIDVNVPAAADSPPITVPSISPELIYAATASASVPNWSM